MAAAARPPQDPQPSASVRLITDPSNPRRQVPAKKANSPFFAHQAEQARRRNIVQAQTSMASSKTTSQPTTTPTRSQRAERRKQRSLFVSLIKWAIVGLLFALGAGQFVAGDILWGYRGKYVQKRYWFPPPQRLFTPEELALYNGLDPKRPIYLSIMGVVYDVTEGRRIYGPGGAYDFFSGRDASRAYVTGCFKPEQGHLTHDLRGLGVEELKGVLDWAAFFEMHPTYHQVGKLKLEPVDQNKPPPVPCDDGKGKDQN